MLVVQWGEIRTYAETREIINCLYVLVPPNVVAIDRPYYIGKAKRLGGSSRARYNPGYGYLLNGLLENGFSLYAAELQPDAFKDAVQYENYLIAVWNPLANRRRKTLPQHPVDTTKPWLR